VGEGEISLKSNEHFEALHGIDPYIALMKGHMSFYHPYFTF
jgi:hypothetical protein